jgi:hypothetical protein
MSAALSVEVEFATLLLRSFFSMDNAGRIKWMIFLKLG